MQCVNRIFCLVLMGVLSACGGNSGTDTSSAGTVSSTSSDESQSSLVSSSSNSSSGATQFTIEEGSSGLCYADGDASESKNTGFSGIGYINTDNREGASIVWAIQAGESREYTLTFRFANGGSAPRDGELLVNDGANGSYTVSLDTTGSWTDWQTQSVNVDLTAGNNIVELSAIFAEGLANIDSLLVKGAPTEAGDCDLYTIDSPYGEIIGDGRMLAQSGNPVHNRFNSAKTKWSASQADIVLSYQLNNGGWPKNQSYDAFGSGGSDAGTFDNNATVTEIVYLAQIYKNTGETKYLTSVRRAMEFILEAQYSSGGWPQFYPLRGGYYDHATYNDNAMASVLTVLHHASIGSAPFDGNVFSATERNRMQTAIAKGVDYILKSQWRQNGLLTVWCAQHGANDFLPKAARAYELQSLSGSESVEVLGFLMTQPQTAEIEMAVKAGLAWFRSGNTRVADTVYINRPSNNSDDNYNPIQSQSGGVMWYRFYDLNSNQGFFSDRDGGTYYDIMDISAERRYGYSWGGNYGSKILSYAQSVGY